MRVNMDSLNITLKEYDYDKGMSQAQTIPWHFEQLN